MNISTFVDDKTKERDGKHGRGAEIKYGEGKTEFLNI
jgi:hypothetical protein